MFLMNPAILKGARHMDVRQDLHDRIDRMNNRELDRLHTHVVMSSDGKDTLPARDQARVSAAIALAGESKGGRPGEPITLDNVEECFTYQTADRDQLERFARVREAMIGAAKAVLREVPDCVDRSTALYYLRTARMWANSAISFRGRF